MRLSEAAGKEGARMNELGSMERFLRVLAYSESLEQRKKKEPSKGISAESEREKCAREDERSEENSKERR
jgi:hypothetical protein